MDVAPSVASTEETGIGASTAAGCVLALTHWGGQGRTVAQRFRRHAGRGVVVPPWGLADAGRQAGTHSS